MSNVANFPDKNERIKIALLKAIDTMVQLGERVSCPAAKQRLADKVAAARAKVGAL